MADFVIVGCACCKVTLLACPPVQDCADLRATGGTPMDEAVELAIERLARCMAEYPEGR